MLLYGGTCAHPEVIGLLLLYIKLRYRYYAGKKNNIGFLIKFKQTSANLERIN